MPEEYLEQIKIQLGVLAKKYGLAVISIKEKEKNKAILEGMQRCRIIIDAFNINNSSLDETIAGVKEFTKLAYGTEESKLLEFLEELKQLRKGKNND